MDTRHAGNSKNSIGFHLAMIKFFNKETETHVTNYSENHFYIKIAFLKHFCKIVHVTN